MGALPPIAWVTGASRGIGKAIAVALAEAGYDVVISARTQSTGETRDNSLTIHRKDERALPGSLDETATQIEALGRRALKVPFDLLDRGAVAGAADRVLGDPEWRGIDAIVHNGRYIGPGLMDVFMDTPLDAYGKFVEAHLIAPIILTQRVLPGMLERGGGVVMMITSSSGYQIPPAPAGQGGWGLAYAVGKAAGHQLAGTVHAEFGSRGIRAFNVQPGFVGTERNQISVREYGKELRGAAPPAAIGAVVKWLLTEPEAGDFAGQNIEAQEFCIQRRLYPDWT